MAKNLTMIRANTQNISLSISPITITAGDMIYFTAKAKYDDDMTDESAAIRKDVTDGITEDGEIIFELTAQETNVEPGKYFYDITLDKADGRRTTLLSGKITIKPVATLRGVNK